MNQTPSHLDALRALTEHRHYAYRGCAPDPDKPRYSAADDRLPLDAWGGSTVDGGIPQLARNAWQRRAIAICERCPVLAACRTYANSELPEGGLAEPDGVQGGQTALDRHRALIDRRTATPTTAPSPAPTGTTTLLSPERLAEARSATKLAILRALAVETDEELVAYRAGMDLRSANWQRSALCKIFGLDKETATRAELLAAAVAHRVLPARTRIVPDGPWPIAAAPTTDGVRQRRLAPGLPGQTVIPGFLDANPPHPAPTRDRAVVPRRRLTLARTTTGPATRPVPLLLPVRTPEVRAA
ncbi:WhiB family transcriptional regulator [Streptomyces hydrogenans]|uniref:hypothetical protein n=1 Tax=Streptomyces hydrogenans TaxID=1873719 RepID=UPI0036E68FC7